MRVAQTTLKTARATCRLYSTTQGPRPVPVLPDISIETFRNQAFNPGRPFILPRGSFIGMPAVDKWFIPGTDCEYRDDRSEEHRAQSRKRTALNREYFLPFGATHVPLEMTQGDQFSRFESVLAFFLECVQAASSTPMRTPRRYFNSNKPGARTVRRTETDQDFFNTKPIARVYLAQASIVDLPLALRNDIPTPDLVLRAGRGDVYDSSIWLGEAPTYTPLHRDPNPNLFVQLAGTKTIRLTAPDIGHAIFSEVQERIGGNASAHIRGEEMMQATEKQALEAMVWSEQNDQIAQMWQTDLQRGDALFIPKGWWHSVKGTGTGMNGSVNWWFR